jgi:FlaA1/EpsC-like NDP-sugar epimerase
VDILLRKNPFAIAGMQSLLVVSSFIAAWLLRFDFSLPHSEVLVGAAFFLVLFRLLAMWRYNLFHGYWRYTGVSDAADIGKAVVLGSVAFFVTMRLVLGVLSLPLSVYLLEALLTATALGGVRVLSRMMLNKFDPRHRSGRVRVLIVGAGAAASALIRELMHTRFEAVGCVDDDKMKKRARLQGLPVLGTIAELQHVAVACQVEEIFIAMPSVTGMPMRRVIEQCLATGMKFKTIPGMGNLLEGHVTVEQLRDVNLEELLGRDPVRLDLKAMRRDLADQVVLVTGAAGSIGQELCSQILACGPAKLICMDQAETPMFFLQLKLTQSNYGDRVDYCVADITDAERVESILHDQGVQIIFNAAAYKHVPMMERNVAEAVRNNVFGLIKLLHAAEKAGCERFLLISSDKAVNPTSVMGATKRLGELILSSRPSKMRCASVRFGNVLGSQGSVVPVFQEQIRKEGRVKVTHPEITRYFMTIPEAVSLVLQAFTIGDHGDVLVLDMGEPVLIADLARTLVRMSGASESDVPIVFTGLRPGEKLFEELFYSTETLLPTPHDKVHRTRGSLASWANLSQQLGELRQLARSGSDQSIRAKIQDIIPEYVYETIRVPSVASTEDIAEPTIPAMILLRAASAND